MFLYPRLPLPRARALSTRFAELSAEDLRQRPTLDLTHARFAPTGGTRISSGHLETLRGRIIEVATAAGWPADTLLARQQFDREVAVVLAQAELPVGEALRPETWAWMTVGLVPHLVQWRFGRSGPAKTERFAGGVLRNALGRLWLRAWVLDEGGTSADRWALTRAITEDAAVAILERTTLSSNRRLARFITKRWLELRALGRSDPEGLLRAAAIRIRIRAALQEFAVLDDSHLARVVSECFEDADRGRANRHLVSDTEPRTADA